MEKRRDLNMTWQPSRFQQDIFAFIRQQTGEMQLGKKPRNLMIRAGAGTGKSSTLVECLKHIPRHFTVIFLAFNKDIVTELEKKVPPNTHVKTFHKSGLGAVRYRYKNIKVDEKGHKMYDIYQEMCDRYYNDVLNFDEISALTSPFIKLVGLCKNTCINPSDENLRCLMDEYNIEINLGDDDYYEDGTDVKDPAELEPTLFGMVRRGLDMSIQDIYNIDFNDMIYMPIALGLPFYKVDIVFVDETQDLNNAQLIMLRKLVKPNGFTVAVGDISQSIYGFRGAQLDAMQRIQSELNASDLPLMETYRCGKKIVSLANRLVPELTAYSGNPDGEVKEIDYQMFYDTVKEGDMVLCRNTSPLITHAFHMLSMGKKVTIKGRDLGVGLMTLVKKLEKKIKSANKKNVNYNNKNNIAEFFEVLGKWKDQETKRAEKRGSTSALQSIDDKYECLVAISEGCDNTKQIISKIEKIFSDEVSPITLSTIHKAKGLEAKRVYLIDPKLIPSKWCKKQWEFEQEKNLLYVAITRAKENLFFTGGYIDDPFDAFDRFDKGCEESMEFVTYS